MGSSDICLLVILQIADAAGVPGRQTGLSAPVPSAEQWRTHQGREKAEKQSVHHPLKLLLRELPSVQRVTQNSNQVGAQRLCQECFLLAFCET